MATVFEVRDEIREVVEPMIPPVKVPERQGRRPVVGRVRVDTASGSAFLGRGVHLASTLPLALGALRALSAGSATLTGPCKAGEESSHHDCRVESCGTAGD